MCPLQHVSLFRCCVVGANGFLVTLSCVLVLCVWFFGVGGVDAFGGGSGQLVAAGGAEACRKRGERELNRGCLGDGRLESVLQRGPRAGPRLAANGGSGNRSADVWATGGAEACRKRGERESIRGCLGDGRLESVLQRGPQAGPPRFAANRRFVRQGVAKIARGCLSRQRTSSTSQ